MRVSPLGPGGAAPAPQPSGRAPDGPGDGVPAPVRGARLWPDAGGPARGRVAALSGRSPPAERLRAACGPGDRAVPPRPGGP